MLTLTDYIASVSSGSLDPTQTIHQYIQTAKSIHQTHNSFVCFDDDYVNSHISKQTKIWPLYGAPIAIKDNILLKDTFSTAGSKILAWYVAPYTATCITNLINHWGLVIGKANMDEFAMGSSTENSPYGPSINPHGSQRVPGWSSGGSAVAVATGSVLAALGTDTGGSIRQPAAFCGIVGLKPTYGRVSRYGVVAMGSSLDQVGTFTHTVQDAATMLTAICWHDPLDATSIARSDTDSRSQCFGQTSLVGLKIALPVQFMGEWLDPQIKQRILDLVSRLQSQWAIVDHIDITLLQDSVPIYYTLMPAEVATNLARFDGLRFGLQRNTFDFDSLHDYLTDIRSAGFGDEVKRRIMIGNYVLSSEQYEGSYLKAQKLRKKLKSDLDHVYQSYDLIIGPTTPEAAWKIGSKWSDPLKVYLSDIYTIPANLVWSPAISLPIGMISDQWESLPIWVQLMAAPRREDILFKVWHHIQQWYHTT